MPNIRKRDLSRILGVIQPLGELSSSPTFIARIPSPAPEANWVPAPGGANPLVCTVLTTANFLHAISYTAQVIRSDGTVIASQTAMHGAGQLLTFTFDPTNPATGIPPNMPLQNHVLLVTITDSTNIPPLVLSADIVFQR
jgi:hypothetical protein